MKINKYAWFSFIVSAALILFLGIALLSGLFTTHSATPFQMFIVITLLLILGVWILSSIVGFLMLLRKGFFADVMERLAQGLVPFACLVGLFILAGLWMVLVLPGPYLLWFASTRIARPQCPQCKNWLPHGATRCVRCDIDVTVPVVVPPASSQSAEALVQPAVTPVQATATPKPEHITVETPPTTCENCHQTTPAGADYTFYYATYEGSQDLGRKTTQYNYRIHGSQDVYLCDKCVTEYGRKWTQRFSLWVSLSMVALAIFIPLCMFITTPLINQGAKYTENPWTLIIFMFVLAAFFYFLGQHQSRRNPLRLGVQLAIKVKSPALKSQGYTRFYTEQQIRDRHLT